MARRTGPMLFAGAILAILQMGRFHQAAGADGRIPREALDIIAHVRDAADRKDVATLRILMAPDFLWSFGGDRSAGQALAAWQEDPPAFARLHAVTSGPCAPIGDGIIECPRNAGTSYRAGFQKTDKGWRMIYFIAGD